MSIFASRTVKTLPIPFDVPHEVTLQKLAGRHLKKAHDVWLDELYSTVRARGGAATQKDMQELFTAGNAAATAAAITEVQADPLNGFDPYTIVQCGVLAWTYDVKVSPAAIDDLDDEAVVFFATEVMRLSKPALFLTQEEAKAAQREADADSSVA